MPQQVPSVGRVVHFYSYGTPDGTYPSNVPWVALITKVETPGDPTSRVALAVCTSREWRFPQEVPYEGTQAAIKPCWGWPPYVPPVE